MDRLSFEIFEPEEKKFWLSPNWIVLILWSFTIFFLWVFDSVFPPHSTIRTVWLSFILVITLYYLISSFFLYKPLHGKINGEIEFQADRMIIKDKVFDLKNITSLDFSLGDYYEEISTLG